MECKKCKQKVNWTVDELCQRCLATTERLKITVPDFVPPSSPLEILRDWIKEADVREWKCNPNTGETWVDYDELLEKIDELLKSEKK